MEPLILTAAWGGREASLDECVADAARWLRAITLLGAPFGRWGFLQTDPDYGLVPVEATTASLRPFIERAKDDYGADMVGGGFKTTLATSLGDERAVLRLSVGAPGRSGNCVNLELRVPSQHFDYATLKNLLAETVACWRPTLMLVWPERFLQFQIRRRAGAKASAYASGTDNWNLDLGWLTYIATPQLPALPEEVRVERIAEGQLVVLSEAPVREDDFAMMRLADRVEETLNAAGLLRSPR